MMNIMQQRARPVDDHPTVVKLRARSRESESGSGSGTQHLTLERVRAIALAAGAADAGVVSLEDPALAEERAHVVRALPGARSLVSIVLDMHEDDVRSPARSVANVEFHRAGHDVDVVAQRIAVELAALKSSLRPPEGARGSVIAESLLRLLPSLKACRAFSS